MMRVTMMTTIFGNAVNDNDDNENMDDDNKMISIVTKWQ